MSEFCKKCFVEKLLDTKSKMLFKKGKLKITLSEENDFCEGCGAISPVVISTAV